MNSDFDINLIEKYFDNELSEKEMNSFNNRLETDAEFRALYDSEVNLHNAIRILGLQHDLHYLQNLEKKIDETNLEAPAFKPSYYYAAAAAVVLILLAIWFVPSGNEPPEKLFETYYKPYANVFEPTLRSSVEATSRAEAFQAYERGDYQKAAVLFNELLNEKMEPGILLLSSNANLNIGNTKEAKANLHTLLNNYDDLDIQAKWYLSLCYMKEGDMESARKLLEELNQTEVSYAMKAKELLKKVD